MPTMERSRTRGAPRGAMAMAVLAATFGAAATMLWSAGGAAAGPAHPGCVEALLKPPTLSTKSGIGRGGQDVEVFLDYPAVEGCESFGRRSQIRFETKGGGIWAPPGGADAWISLTHGLAGTDGAIEVGVDGDEAPALPLACRNGDRPRVRVQVRTRAIILATMKNDGQSPIKTFPIPYRPASAAHCG